MPSPTVSSTTVSSLKGSIVAIVTPMNDDGSLDISSLSSLASWHVDEGTHGIVVMGTTGESPTVTDAEWEECVKTVVTSVNHRIPVIAGTGTNCTASTIKKTLKAQQLGADSALIVTPYYNKPTQEGLIAHFKAIADATNNTFPICLYNVPGRTGGDLLPETCVKILQACPSVYGVKEAGGSIKRFSELRSLLPPPFIIYSGEDCLTSQAIIDHQADGVISVTANVAPRAMSTMCTSALSKDKQQEAKKIDATLEGLHKYLFAEPNPTPTKYALSKMNKIKNGIRLPLLPLTSKNQEAVQQAMKDAQVEVK